MKTKQKINHQLDYTSKEAKEAMNAPKRKRFLRVLLTHIYTLSFMRGLINEDDTKVDFRILVENDDAVKCDDPFFYSVWVNSVELGMFSTPDFYAVKHWEFPYRFIRNIEIRRHFAVSQNLGLGHLWKEEVEKYQRAHKKKDNTPFENWLKEDKEPNTLNAFLHEVYYEISLRLQFIHV